MKKISLFLIAICFCMIGKSQVTNEPTSDSLLIELSELSCTCIEEIKTYDRDKEAIAQDISTCINEQTVTYQVTDKMMKIMDSTITGTLKEGKNEVEISITVDEKSDEYKKYYYKLERYLMANCPALKSKIASSDKENSKSISKNKKAYAYYSEGLDEFENENYKQAIKLFQKALKEDPIFAFAWDNMGLAYRKLEQYDDAIDAYKKSLELDPNGLMPLQNIAVAYIYKKQYDKAIEAYEKLADIDSNNPEIFYGIGSIYATVLMDNEKGLQNMCIAYNLYIKQKSPYRADAEKMINYIFASMKEQGKEERFNEILKENGISTSSE